MTHLAVLRQAPHGMSELYPHVNIIRHHPRNYRFIIDVWAVVRERNYLAMTQLYKSLLTTSRRP